MVFIHTTDWQPMVILGGISKKKETKLQMYRRDNFLDQFKPGINLNGEPLFTNYSRNLVAEGIGPIYVLGPGGLYEPLVAEEARGIVELDFNETVDSDVKLWQRFEGVDEIATLHPGTRLLISPNDLAPTRTDLRTMLAFFKRCPDAAAVVPGIDARPLVQLGFRKNLEDKIYTVQGENSTIEYVAFPQIYAIEPSRLPLTTLVAKVAKDVYEIRGEGTKGPRMMYELVKDITLYLWNKEDARQVSTAWRALKALVKYNPSTDILGPVETGILNPVTYAEIEDVLTRILSEREEDPIVVGRIDAPGIAMDVDTKTDLLGLRNHHARSSNSAHTLLHAQGALEPW